MNSNFQNVLALNQTVLGKAMIIGKGFVEGNESTPLLTDEGLEIYYNGTHVLPPLSQPHDYYYFGEVVHPDLMPGMPGSGGTIKYFLADAGDQYGLVAEVKLDKDAVGVSDPVRDLVGVAFKNENLFHFKDKRKELFHIFYLMLRKHFTFLFQHFTLEDLNEWNFETVPLRDLARYCVRNNS